jgi:hypothetical protein
MNLELVGMFNVRPEPFEAKLSIVVHLQDGLQLPRCVVVAQGILSENREYGAAALSNELK